jgi:hypothetical protein
MIPSSFTKFRFGFSLLLLASSLALAQTATFTVPTSQAWTDTGLELKTGQTLTISAATASGGCDPAGVSGAAAQNLPVPTALPGALLARLEANGPAWLVGASQTLRVISDGHLWLGVNTAGSAPCNGSFSVKVLGASALPASAANTAAAAASTQSTQPATGETLAANNASAANNTKSATGAQTQTANKDQITDVKGALNTALQTWLSGQLGTGTASTAAGSNATGNGAATGVPAAAIPKEKISTAALDSGLRKDLDGLPRRVNDQFNNLGDMVNFVIVGDQKKVADALSAADWHIADRDTKESVVKAAIETYEKKAYLTMPMSELYLYGRVQDFGYEQAEPYAVVASRHHFRIWKAPFTYDGKEVWVGAGTHDIGFEKDQRNGKVTHKIDPAVDGERDNIGATLEKSGQVKLLSYYLPPNAVQESKNATGGGYHSDGRVLVIELK